MDVAQVLVFGLAGEHVVDVDEDSVSNGDDSPLLTAASGEAAVLGLKVAAALPSRGLGRLGERSAQPAIGVSCTTRAALAGALVVAGTDTSPGAEMIHRWETAHLRPDLRKNILRRSTADAGMAVEALDHLFKRGQAPGHLRIENCHLSFKEIELAQQGLKQHALVITHEAAQGESELSPFGAQRTLGKIGEGERVGVALNQRLEDRSSCCSRDIARHGAELDVGALQELLDLVNHPRALLQQAPAMARQVAQFPLRPIGDEARAQQSVSQQFRDPFGVLHVGLATRHCLDVLGIDDKQLEIESLEQVVDWPPVDAAALHGDVRYLMIKQPVAQLEKVSRHRSERLCHAGLRRHNARHYRLLVDVQASTSWVSNLHSSASKSAADGRRPHP